MPSAINLSTTASSKVISFTIDGPLLVNNAKVVLTLSFHVTSAASDQLINVARLYTTPQGLTELDGFSDVDSVTVPVARTVDVVNSYAGIGIDGSGRYFLGETVYIDAGTHPSGYTFAGWVVAAGIAVLDDASAVTTSFSMPTTDVVIVANWVNSTPPVTVTTQLPGVTRTVTATRYSTETTTQTVTATATVTNSTVTTATTTATTTALATITSQLPGATQTITSTQLSTITTTSVSSAPTSTMWSTTTMTAKVSSAVPTTTWSDEPPSTRDTRATWAILNLILATWGALLVLIAPILAVVWRGTGKLNPILLVIAIILAIVGVIVFLLTQNINNKATWVDVWTVLNLTIFVAEIILLTLIFKLARNAIQ